MASPDSLRRAADVVVAAKIPVLAISGGWSPTFDAVSEVAAQLTNGRHVIVPSSNHFPQQTNPEEFNKVLLAFANDAAARRDEQSPKPR